MNLLRPLLARAFPLMALSGLLLAGWGLIVTPEEIRVDARMELREPAGAERIVAALFP